MTNSFLRRLGFLLGMTLLFQTIHSSAASNDEEIEPRADRGSKKMNVQIIECQASVPAGVPFPIRVKVTEGKKPLPSAHVYKVIWAGSSCTAPNQNVMTDKNGEATIEGLLKSGAKKKSPLSVWVTKEGYSTGKSPDVSVARQ